jgi:hypothetical protein
LPASQLCDPAALEASIGDGAVTLLILLPHAPVSTAAVTADARKAE